VITDYNQTRRGNVTTVNVTSSLSGVVYFHWYVDGVHVAATTSPEWTFRFEGGEQVRVEVVDTADPDFDTVAGAPAGWPARRLLWWTASVSADCAHYRVEQKKATGSWETVGLVHHQADQWAYQLLTDRLDDLTEYTWRIVPVDTAGNDGTAKTIGPETVVRTPDAPDFDISFDSGTTQVTFSEAA